MRGRVDQAVGEPVEPHEGIGDAARSSGSGRAGRGVGRYVGACSRSGRPALRKPDAWRTSGSRLVLPVTAAATFYSRAAPAGQPAPGAPG